MADAPLPPPRPAGAPKKEPEKCNTCCQGQHYDEKVDLTVAPGLSIGEREKAMMDYAQNRYRADPCLDDVSGNVREAGGPNVTTGGWSRQRMNELESGYTNPRAFVFQPTPSYTLTPGTVATKTLTGGP